jgi:protein TonB
MRFYSKLILALLALSILTLSAPKFPVAQTLEELPSPDDFVVVEAYPEMIYQHQPVYPEDARKASIEGTVFLRTLVNREGSPLQVDITKSSGNLLLDSAALEAAQKCRFKPAIQNGRPVAIWITYSTTFKLADSQEEPSEDKRPFIKVDKMPEILHEEPVVYPPDAREAGIEGKVLVQALVNKEGKPTKVRVEESSGANALDKAALDAVKKYFFSPTVSKGKPVEIWITIPVEFKLE